MTRFVSKEMATDYELDISAAKRDLSYHPRITVASRHHGIDRALSCGQRVLAAGYRLIIVRSYSVLFFSGASITLNQRLLVMKETGLPPEIP
jgi:hypothetical protein